MFNSVAGIILKNSRYFLGRRKPGGAIGGKWEFPGGKVEDGENFHDALKREFLEELEVDIVVKDFITKKEFYHNNNKFILNAYFIELLIFDVSYNEHVEFKWFTHDELIKLEDSLADSDRLLLDFI